MKIIYRVPEEEIEFVYFSFSLQSTVKDILDQLKEDGQIPELLLYKGRELINTNATLLSYGFSENSANEISGTSRQTNGMKTY